MDVSGGRIGRDRYWIAIVVLSVVGFLGGFASVAAGIPPIAFAIILGPIGLLVCAARARDIGRSGWLCLLTLIPVLGWIAVIWLGCIPSEHDFPTQPSPTE